MDKDVEQFQADLLQSVREMKAGRSARVTTVPVSSVTAVRNAAGLSQAQFAAVLGVSRRTLQGWEQGRRQPTGAARTLLRVAERHPEVLRELAAA
jgi:putative transcriptional regulator